MTPLEETRDLKFYENNAQDDFASTPISVLRYISELEKRIKTTEEIAIGFDIWKWKNDWRRLNDFRYGNLTTLEDKTDSELFKDYMESLKP